MPLLLMADAKEREDSSTDPWLSLTVFNHSRWRAVSHWNQKIESQWNSLQNNKDTNCCFVQLSHQLLWEVSIIFQCPPKLFQYLLKGLETSFWFQLIQHWGVTKDSIMETGNTVHIKVILSSRNGGQVNKHLQLIDICNSINQYRQPQTDLGKINKYV